MKSVAIGIGCRKNTPAQAIIGLVREVLALLPEAPANVRLCSSERRSQQAGLREASVTLGLALVFFSHVELAAVAERILTRSAKVREVTGLDGVAESAALVGAGPRAKIVVPRRTAGGAACAIAADFADAEKSP